MDGSAWLDLFAGTGQVGIEALSRGADRVLFVEKARPAVQTIKANLGHTQLQDRAQIIQGDAFGFLDRFSGGGFDLVFVAPPQYRQLWIKSLQLIDEKSDSLLLPGGSVVVQIDPKEFSPVELKRLFIADQRRYGSTLLLFYSVR